MNSEVSNKVDGNLARLLAEHHQVALKCRNFHWNVTGPRFAMFHALFDQLYEEIEAAGDEIAERLRARGGYAPGTLAEYAALGRVEEVADRPDADEMVRRLVEDMVILAEEARGLHEAAEREGDPATADLAARRLAAAQKGAWLLKSHLEG